MSKFIKSLEHATERYFPVEKSEKRSTSEIMNEVFGAIDKFAAGAKKFNQSADSSPFQAAKDAGASIYNSVKNIGKTKGDIALQDSIKRGWENMTKQQRAMYNQPNEYFVKLAQDEPAWANAAKMTGFKRYKVEQEFKSDPANKSYLQDAGLAPTYDGRPSTSDATAWDQWVQNKWSSMTPQLQDKYGSFENFDEIKRAEASGGA